jgi:hypothetical protein
VHDGGANDEILQLVLVTEHESFRGTHLHTAGLGVAVIQQVGAARTFLGKAQLLVPVYSAVGAGFRQLLAASGLYGVDDHQAVLPAIHVAVPGHVQKRTFLAVVAHLGNVMDLHLGSRAVDIVIDLDPELADIGLGRRDG